VWPIRRFLFGTTTGKRQSLYWHWPVASAFHDWLAFCDKKARLTNWTRHWRPAETNRVDPALIFRLSVCCPAVRSFFPREKRSWPRMPTVRVYALRLCTHTYIRTTAVNDSRKSSSTHANLTFVNYLHFARTTAILLKIFTFILNKCIGDDNTKAAACRSPYCISKTRNMWCNVIMTNLERHMQHKRLQGLCTKNSQWYSQTEGKDMLNRCDFRCVLKVENVKDRRR